MRRGGRGVKLGAGASDIGVDPVLGMAHEQAGKQRQASAKGVERNVLTVKICINRSNQSSVVVDSAGARSI